MSNSPTLSQRVVSLVEPWFLLSWSMKSFVKTFYEQIVKTGSFPTPARMGKVKDDSFSTFWTALTAPIDPPPPPVGSSALVRPLLSRAYGTVLDIGPGSGSTVDSFSNNDNIKVIYGAEPSAGLHPALRQQLEKYNLTDKYNILSCPAERGALAEALAGEGVKTDGAKIFDTIICVRVLCSVPDQAGTVKNFYNLLKPGGQLIVIEHICNPWRKSALVGGNGRGSIAGRLMQAVYQLLGWSFFLGACEMTRDTETTLREAGEWEAVELKVDFWWAPLAYVSGVLTKKR